MNTENVTQQIKNAQKTEAQLQKLRKLRQKRKQQKRNRKQRQNQSKSKSKSISVAPRQTRGNSSKFEDFQQSNKDIKNQFVDQTPNLTNFQPAAQAKIEQHIMDIEHQEKPTQPLEKNEKTQQIVECKLQVSQTFEIYQKQPQPVIQQNTKGVIEQRKIQLQKQQKSDKQPNKSSDEVQTQLNPFLTYFRENNKYMMADGGDKLIAGEQTFIIKFKKPSTQYEEIKLAESIIIQETDQKKVQAEQVQQKVESKKEIKKLLLKHTQSNEENYYEEMLEEKGQKNPIRETIINQLMDLEESEIQLVADQEQIVKEIEKAEIQLKYPQIIIQRNDEMQIQKAANQKEVIEINLNLQTQKIQQQVGIQHEKKEEIEVQNNSNLPTAIHQPLDARQQVTQQSIQPIISQKQIQKEALMIETGLTAQTSEKNIKEPINLTQQINDQNKIQFPLKQVHYTLPQVPPSPRKIKVEQTQLLRAPPLHSYHACIIEQLPIKPYHDHYHEYKSTIVPLVNRDCFTISVNAEPSQPALYDQLNKIKIMANISQPIQLAGDIVLEAKQQEFPQLQAPLPRQKCFQKDNYTSENLPLQICQKLEINLQDNKENNYEQLQGYIKNITTIKKSTPANKFIKSSQNTVGINFTNGHNSNYQENLNKKSPQKIKDESPVSLDGLQLITPKKLEQEQPLTNPSFLQNIEKTISQFQSAKNKNKNTPSKLVIQTITPEANVKQVLINANRIKVFFPQLSPNNQNKVAFSLQERQKMQHRPILIQQEENEQQEREMRRPYKLNRNNLDQIKISSPTAINIAKQHSKDKSPIHLQNHKHKGLPITSILQKEVNNRQLIQSRHDKKITENQNSDQRKTSPRKRKLKITQKKQSPKINQTNIIVKQVRPFELIDQQIYIMNSKSKSKQRRLSQKKLIVTLKEKSFQSNNQNIKIEIKEEQVGCFGLKNDSR